MRRTWGLMLAIAAAMALGIVPASAGAATITPTITTDELNGDADCSLREAVQAARDNAAVSGCDAGQATLDTIQLGALEYDLTLTTGGNPEDNNAQGDLDLGGGPLDIVGASTIATSIDASGIGGGGDRAIHLVLEIPASLRNLNLRDGNTSAYAVGSADSRGGDVLATQGSLTLSNVAVIDGTAIQGGGIYAQNDATLTITDSLVSGNTGVANGGGLTTANDSVITIVRSRFDQNHATDNTAGEDVEGGAIRHGGDALLTIVDSELTDNDATNESLNAGDTAWGGAIVTASTTTIRRSLIAGNSASSAQPGTAELAGGIYAGGGSIDEPVEIVNTTIYDNSAGNPDGDGGGLHNNGPAPVSLSHVTFSGNFAADEGDSVHALAGTTTLRASIVPTTALADPCDGPGISSTGFNAAVFDDPDCNYIASDSTSGGPIGIQGGGPVINGGFTPTIGLDAGGREVDLVPAAECGPSEGQDQRGFFRPSGPGCDAGAYERVTCNGVVQEGPGAIDCPPLPPVVPISTPPGIVNPCANLKGKKRKRCLCKQKKGKKRKKCLKRLKARKP